MFQRIIRIVGGDPNKREVERLSELVDEINSLEQEYEALSDDGLTGKTAEFRKRLEGGETLDDIMMEAFAAVREASKRTIGQRHYDVQMVGGITLHQGKIAEMRTGEGKTLVATLPLYLNALSGKGVHLVTVNDYLARRDPRWMGPIYRILGMNVGVLQMAARTENGRNAYLYDPEISSPHEDSHQLKVVSRGEAYRADITYGTNSEFGFDYLRDNLTMSLADRVQRGHHYAVVDEVDNILIDEARTPLIISGPASEDTEWYTRMAQVTRQLEPEDYEISEKDHTVSMTEAGEGHVEMLLDMALKDPERPEDITPEQARVMGYLEQSLRAQYLFRRNKDYLVQGGKVIIIDEFTGRLMPGRRWSDGLHQAVEAKEGVKVEPENVTYATITLQNYFRMYKKLAGMTGTALTEAEEFYKIYKLDVLPIPTNLEYQAFGSDAPLVEIETRDPQGYKYSYYARKSDTEKKQVFFRRKDYPDVVFRTEEAKLRAITKEIVYYYITGRPQLVGTTSVEHSERLSERLHAEPLRRLFQTMLIRQAWLVKNNREADERAIPELKLLYKSLDELAVPELRQFARSIGMNSINPEDESNLTELLKLLNLGPEDNPRLVSVLQGGVPHQVLNARKHDEESQIIAHAGAFGSVTIATNMAGRGVDIKLGGELPEEVLSGVNHILARTGSENPYDMTMDARLKALQAISPEEFGIYEEDAKAFLKYMDEMRRVRELGGLHVIGSERHEARRIDNQLRGRSARQGDPGSSRFYLSLEDELMRLFGGAQVEGLLARLNIDEALPIESGMVGRLVEQSQGRVEGSNFDVRKHLLEYDDVLNSQRERIYSQRDRVFSKEDLREDVTDMLRSELQQRIPKSLKDEEGPWKLLAYLEEIQPPLDFPEVVFPSYPFRIVIDEIGTVEDVATLRERLLELAERSVKAENEHMLRSAQTIIQRAAENQETQLAERFETLDTFVDNQGEVVESEDGQAPKPRRPQEVMDELSSLVRVQLRFSNEQLRLLISDPKQIVEDVQSQVTTALNNLTLMRLINTFERRLEESLNLKVTQLQTQDWNEAIAQIMQAVENALQRREDRLLGAQGQIAHDLDADVTRLEGAVADRSELIRLLEVMAQGARLTFDAKTHRRSYQLTTRLRYVYLAARLLEEREAERITREVLSHLEEAQEKMSLVWGLSEWNRIDRSTVLVENLDPAIRRRLEDMIGPERLLELNAKPVEELNPEDQDAVIFSIGQRIQSEIYRQLLLSVISELWVDYLTKVEALRVSIGLEAYAQRDPLVQYKSKASVMFGELLSDVRVGVISRMFIYRPRPPEKIQAERAPEQVTAEPAMITAPRTSDGKPLPAGKPGVSQPAAIPSAGGSKKKRKRH